MLNNNQSSVAKAMEDKKISAIDGGEVSTARLQALTDGIFAIAMTILVLDIHVPDLVSANSARELLTDLQMMLPRIASFGVSFIVLAMFWVAHHTQYRFIKKLDQKLMWLNMFYLLSVSLLPFTAALLGQYHENQTAAVVYAGQLIVMVLIQYVMWRHAISRKVLMVEDLDPRVNKMAARLAVFATGSYAGAILLSFWSVNFSLIVYALVPLPYIFGWIYYLG